MCSRHLIADTTASDGPSTCGRTRVLAFAGRGTNTNDTFCPETVVRWEGALTVRLRILERTTLIGRSHPSWRPISAGTFNALAE
jgi:hypothetical protein